MVAPPRPSDSTILNSQKTHVTVIRPPDKPTVVGGSHIFLAGPIQAAPEWHDDAIKILTRLAEKAKRDITIACPKRAGVRKPLVGKDYAFQVAWEVQFMRLSQASDGAVMFWLPCAAQTSARPYAQTSRFELGEAFCHNLFSRINLVVGMEEGFPNERYIRQRLAGVGGLWGQKFSQRVKVWPTLEATCKAVMATLGKGNT